MAASRAGGLIWNRMLSRNARRRIYISPVVDVGSSAANAATFIADVPTGSRFVVDYVGQVALTAYGNTNAGGTYSVGVDTAGTFSAVNLLAATAITNTPTAKQRAMISSSSLASTLKTSKTWGGYPIVPAASTIWVSTVKTGTPTAATMQFVVAGWEFDDQADTHG